MAAAEHSSIALRAAGAGAWTVGTRLATKLIDFAMLLCLARFLGPAEFGLVAMAMAVIFIVEALFDLPLAAALIRVPDLTPGMLHTAFTLSLLRGLLVGLLVLAVSWPLAAFNNEPRLTVLLVVLALAPAMRGLVNPRMVEYARALDFRPDAVLELSGKVVALIVAVIVAATTRSYWAIAAATVCAPLVATLLSYGMVPWRPRLTFTHWAQFSNLIGWNFLSQTGAALNWQVDRLLLPRLTSTAAFGAYAVGRQLAEFPWQALIQPLSRPVMQALASAGDAREARYLQLSRAIALLMAPVMGLLLLWPEVLVRVALGPAWSAAAQWLCWISVVGLAGLPAMLMPPLAMTLDRTRWVAVRTLVELLVRLPLVWLGAVHWGIPGAIAASAVATATGTVASLFIVRRLIGARLSHQLVILWQPLTAMLLAGAVLWLAKPWVMAAPSLPELLVRAAPLGLLYLLLYAVWVLLAWRLAGQPAGLEKYFVDTVRARFTRARVSASDAAKPNDAMEAHVKQPH